MAASDEAFGEKENLLNPGPVDFTPGSFGARGEIVDGWETRRRRHPGVDWALVRLGVPGIIRTIDVDTTSFTGNHPQGCRVQACGVEGYPGPEELADADWHEIVGEADLAPDRSNVFTVASTTRFTHVRLMIWPDGGVGRLRICGDAVPDPRQFDIGGHDLASQLFGGLVIESSDGFYSPAHALNRPDEARSMGEGWETRRSRGREPDWVVIRLATKARVHGVVVDTAYFRYNASAAVSLQGADDPNTLSWKELLPPVRLQPDTRHTFWLTDSDPPPPVTHVRLEALPDGGLSRLRVIATPDAEGRRALGETWWNSLPASQRRQVLTEAGLPTAVADELAQSRPPSADAASGHAVVRRMLFGATG